MGHEKTCFTSRMGHEKNTFYKQSGHMKKYVLQAEWAIKTRYTSRMIICKTCYINIIVILNQRNGHLQKRYIITNYGSV